MTGKNDSDIPENFQRLFREQQRISDQMRLAGINIDMDKVNEMLANEHETEELLEKLKTSSTPGRDWFIYSINQIRPVYSLDEKARMIADFDAAPESTLRDTTIERQRSRVEFIIGLDNFAPPLTKEQRVKMIDDYDEQNRTWQGIADDVASGERPHYAITSDGRVQRDPADLRDKGHDFEGRLGDYSHIEDPVHRAKLDEAFEKTHAALESAKAWDAAEERAKARMEGRKAFAAKMALRIRRVVRIVALAALLAVVALGAWAYLNIKTIVPAWDKYADDSRTCLVKVGDRVVTGTRNYAYRYYNVLGWEFHYAPDTNVKTRIDPNGNAMTIVAHFADNTIQTISIGNSDVAKKELPAAENYTFFMDGGKSTGAATYAKLCR